MATIAELIHRTLVGREDEAELAAVRDDVTALCSKFPPYPTGPEPALQAYLGDYRAGHRCRLRVTLVAPRSSAGWLVASAWWRARRAPGPHRPDRVPRWPGDPLGFLVALFVAAGWTTFPVFDRQSVPSAWCSAALMIFAVGQRRRPARGVGAGQGRRDGAGRRACSRCSASACSSSASPSPGSSCCRPTCRRCSPCSGSSAWRRPSTSSTGSTVWPPASWPSPRARFFLYCDRLDPENGVLGPDNAGPSLAVVVLGMCLGFLPHNFHPARIFMGDGGALLLGLLMAASTMLVGGQTDDALQRPDLLLLRAALHPARHPRRADPRHAVRPSCAGPQGLSRCRGRQGPPPPPAHAPRPRPPPQRAHPVDVDRAAVGLRALPVYTRRWGELSCRSGSRLSAWCCTPVRPGVRRARSAVGPRPDPRSAIEREDLTCPGSPSF